MDMMINPVNDAAAGGRDHNAPAVACRRCGNQECYRIRRGTLARSLFSWLNLRHYRCAKCRRKFYVLT
ncbi:hypothetical protein C7T94_17550 [Pedobacter yulinensis]|uniref:Uncharacterized protein n=1 Tax=Pedobacter yulinensis TaxID=2126353 RepID=A0A2T3HHY9_9SPHI|nr:hypothetical protein C7T94_17550 [Pedobacter yulinensis]